MIAGMGTLVLGQEGLQHVTLAHSHLGEELICCFFCEQMIYRHLSFLLDSMRAPNDLLGENS